MDLDFKALLLPHGSLLSFSAEIGFWVTDLCWKESCMTNDTPWLWCQNLTTILSKRIRPSECHSLDLRPTDSANKLFRDPSRSMEGASSCPSAWQSSWKEGRQLRDFINYGEALWTVGQVEAVPYANADMQLLGNMKSYPNGQQ